MAGSEALIATTEPTESMPAAPHVGKPTQDIKLFSADCAKLGGGVGGTRTEKPGVTGQVFKDVGHEPSTGVPVSETTV